MCYSRALSCCPRTCVCIIISYISAPTCRHAELNVLQADLGFVISWSRVREIGKWKSELVSISTELACELAASACRASELRYVEWTRFTPVQWYLVCVFQERHLAVCYENNFTTTKFQEHSIPTSWFRDVQDNAQAMLVNSKGGHDWYM